MGFTALIDVFIGLALLYVGASLFVTVANEYVAGLLKLRAKHLGPALDRLLGLGSLRLAVKRHPALAGVLDAAGRPGSYIDPNTLAAAMVGSLRPDTGGPASLEDLVRAARMLPESTVKNVLLGLAQTSGSAEKFAESIALWADRSLKLMGERYKRWLQHMSFGLGLAVAIGFNVDTLQVTQRLYGDKVLREQLAQEAVRIATAIDAGRVESCAKLDLEQRRKDPACADLVRLQDSVFEGSGKLGELPIGWRDANLAEKLLSPLAWLGWLLTALAVSLGAPFWFDLLSKASSIRHAARRPEPQKSG